ncbi:MAG: endospore germination permease [Dehalobacterium sp.]
MEKKEYLTNMQIGLLVLFASIADTLFFVPGEAVTIVFQDVWISIILATGITSVLTIYPLAQMGMNFPGCTIIQYSNYILGKTGGKLAGGLLVFSFFQLHAWSLREFSELGSVFLPETPFLVFFIVLSFAATLAAFQGIEVIGRCAQFIFPLGLMALILVALINMSDINLDNLRPVLETNLSALVKSVLSPLDWLTIGVAFGVITANSNNPQGLKKAGIIAIGTSGLILTVFSLVMVSVFGPFFLANTNFPLLLLASYGRMGSLEAVIITVWFAWIFIRAALYAYVTCISILHLFGLKDLRSVILGEAILAAAYSLHLYSSFMELSYHFSIGHLYYEIMQILIPLGIWMVFLIRKQKICSLSKE